MLLAKTNQSSNARTEGRCRLQAGDDYDDSNRGLRLEGTPEAHSLQLVHAFPGPGTVVLACRSPQGDWSAADSKIIAIKVAERQLERRLGLADENEAIVKGAPRGALFARARLAGGPDLQVRALGRERLRGRSRRTRATRCRCRPACWPRPRR